MANRIYLQVEFGSGSLYQYSKEPKEGFEEHRSKTNKVSYRQYFKEGVYGVYRGTTLRDSNFGKEISVHFINAQGDDVYINFPLYNQNKQIASYAESFIAILPAMELNYVYRFFPYAVDKEKGEGKNYGISVKHADMHAKTVVENFPLEKLKFSYEKQDGTKVEGDVPAVQWKKHFDDSNIKDTSEKDGYLYQVLMKFSQERTSGVSNKITAEEPPKPYTGGFGNGAQAPSQEPQANNDAPAHMPEPTPEAVNETPAQEPRETPAAVSQEPITGGAMASTSSNGKKKDLPF